MGKDYQRKFRKMGKWFMGVLVMLVILSLPVAKEASGRIQIGPIQVGDVLVTRNQKWDNKIPGRWNHVAIYIGKGYVIEAQLDDDLVKLTQRDRFWSHYPEILVLRLREDRRHLVPDMVEYAKKLAGQPYSIFPRGNGVSCVMVIRLSYYFATCMANRADDPGWLIPDGIVNDDSRFFCVGRK